MGTSRRTGRRGRGTVFRVHVVNCGRVNSNDRLARGRGRGIEALQVRLRPRMLERGKVEKLLPDRRLSAARATRWQRCFSSGINVPLNPYGERLDLIGYGIRVRLDFLDNCARRRSFSPRGDFDGPLRGLRERLS